MWSQSGAEKAPEVGIVCAETMYRIRIRDELAINMFGPTKNAKINVHTAQQQK